jgi:hypothetical protein
MQKKTIALSILAVSLVVACGGGDTTSPLPTGSADARVASALSAIGFAVATADEGAAFFDNYLPCLRRGVVTWVDDATGRAAVFHGCEVTPGVVLDGSGRIQWVGSGLAPARDFFCTSLAPSSCLTAFRWAGPLRITLGDTAQVDLDAFTVSSIVARARGGPPFMGLRSWRTDVTGQAFDATDSLAFESLIDSSGITIATLPNPGQSVASLTDADLARLAHHFGMLFGFTLVGELDYAGGGGHTHTMPCGTTVVTYDAAQLPILQNTWTGCGYGGLVTDGTFSMRWGVFDLHPAGASTIRMDVAGNFRIGGGIPVVSLTSLRWTVSNIPSSYPGTVTIRLELTGTGGTRSWTAVVPVDD